MNNVDLAIVDPDTLPPQIRQLVIIIGLAEAFKLLQARGGTQLRIPKISRRAEVLPDILSHGAVDKLCKAMPGKIIDVPKADKILLQIRNQAICESRGTRSASQLAQEYDLTRRQIINICKESVDDNGQVDLFEEQIQS